MLRVHDSVYQKTNGWIGIAYSVYPACCSTPSAPRPAKPGAPTLTYARDGDDYLIVASKGGDPKARLVSQPEGEPERQINVGPKRFRVTATRSCPTTRTRRGCGRSSTRTTATVTRRIRRRRLDPSGRHPDALPRTTLWPVAPASSPARWRSWGQCRDAPTQPGAPSPRRRRIAEPKR